MSHIEYNKEKGLIVVHDKEDEGKSYFLEIVTKKEELDKYAQGILPEDLKTGYFVCYSLLTVGYFGGYKFNGDIYAPAEFKTIKSFPGTGFGVALLEKV